MKLLTITLTVAATENELFGEKASDALRELAESEPFRQGTWDPKTQFITKNGTSIFGDYRMSDATEH